VVVVSPGVVVAPVGPVAGSFGFCLAFGFGFVPTRTILGSAR
jgi:hypothetical protein